MGRSRKRRSEGPEKATPSVKAIILIPLTYNDATEVPATVREGILDEIFLEFGGHTHEGIVRGAYRMQSGEKCVEDLAKVAVVLTPKQLPLLRRMVGRWCRLLGQEAMYLEITTSAVEFIRPAAEEQSP